ncbi:MAG: hypothetical protein EBT26_09080, partial [Microbacteriaceae bacterium]|nr:hypothetical protein [Microbacteriaceae bacterium]
MREGEIITPRRVLPTTERLALPEIKNIQDTRGQGKQFHGAREPIQTLEEGYYSPENIYGGESTFYTTDAIDIAAGYQRKKPNSIIYETVEKEPVNFFNMEDRFSTSRWMQMFPESGMNLPSDDFIKYGIQSASEKYGNPNLREIMDEMRLESANEGYSKDSLQEFFAIITEKLEKMGFGGMQHVGGIKTNKPKHLVKIYFQPSRQIELKPVAKSGAPAAEPAAPVGQPIPRPMGGRGGEAGFIISDPAEKARAIAQRWATSRGDLPKEAFDILEAKDQRIQAMQKQVDFTLRDLAKATVESNGKRVLTEPQKAIIDSYMRGQTDVLPELPEPLQGPVAQMRRQLDNLTERLVESNVFTGPKAEAVLARRGEYVTRSYEKYDNPKFGFNL